MNQYFNKHIEYLIAQGEHQQLDFKFKISDSKKIARTLAAFANTDGGKLLIGVKDNGAIAGIRSIEEFHMLEAAAHMFCKPEVPFIAKEWIIEGKTVLEADIPKREGEPHKAPDKDGNMMVYIRVDDQNFLANLTLLKVWQKKEEGVEVNIEYTESERSLLSFLRENNQITLNKYSKIASLKRKKAEEILIDFILLNIIEMVITEKQVYYKLTDKYLNEN